MFLSLFGFSVHYLYLYISFVLFSSYFLVWILVFGSIFFFGSDTVVWLINYNLDFGFMVWHLVLGV